jgi:Methyltransferase small domain
MDWLFYLILMGILAVIVLYSFIYGITPTPTSPKVKNKLLEMLPELTEQEIVELGSGWGTLAFALARHFPNCQVHAYEISPIPFLVSIILSKWFAFPNLTIKRKDFFHISLKNVALATCYLYPEAMNRLKNKFERELSPEASVMTHTFAIPGWIPIRFERVDDLYLTPIYLYQIKSSKGNQK